MEDVYEGSIGNDSTIHFWSDKWNGICLQSTYPELFSFCTNPAVSLQHVIDLEHLEDLFHRPLSTQAHQQFLTLTTEMATLEVNTGADRWRQTMQHSTNSCMRMYKALIGPCQTHNLFKASLEMCSTTQTQILLLFTSS